MCHLLLIIVFLLHKRWVDHSHTTLVFSLFIYPIVKFTLFKIVKI